MRALSAVGLAMFAHAFSITSLFPYVGFLVVELTSIDSVDRAGNLAGVVGASFMFGRTVSSAFWGWVSDVRGRKCVVLIGRGSIAVFSLIFGLSKSFVVAVLARFLIGLGNGIAGAGKTAVSELCDEENQPRGMAFVTGSWSLGLIVGPAIGGVTYGTGPATFPFFVPNAITASLALSAAVMVHRYMPETAAHLLSYKKLGDGRDADLADDQSSDGTDDLEQNPMHEEARYELMSSATECVREAEIELNGQRTSAEATSENDPLSAGPLDAALVDERAAEKQGGEGFRELLKRPKARAVLFLYFLYNHISHAFDEVFPLFCIATREKGGMEQTASFVGIVLAITGLLMFTFQLIVYPFIAAKLSPRTALIAFNLLPVPFFLTIPFMHDLEESVRPSIVAVPMTICVLSTRLSASVCYSSLFLETNSAAPPESRGRLNGLSMTVGSVAKAMAPLFGSMIFAWSLQTGGPWPLGTNFAFFLLAVFSGIVAAATSVLLPKPI